MWLSSNVLLSIYIDIQQMQYVNKSQKPHKQDYIGLTTWCALR